MSAVLWTLLVEMASHFRTRVICFRSVLKPQSIRSLRCSTLFNGGKRLIDATNLEITQLSETSQSRNCSPAPPRSSCKCTMQCPFQALMGQTFTRFKLLSEAERLQSRTKASKNRRGHREQLYAQLAEDLICKRYRQIEYTNVVDDPWHPCVGTTEARKSCAGST